MFCAGTSGTLALAEDNRERERPARANKEHFPVLINLSINIAS